MTEINELQKFIGDGKKAINRILSILEYNKIDIPVWLDLEETRELFIYMRGWVDCLEKHN